MSTDGRAQRARQADGASASSPGGVLAMRVERHRATAGELHALEWPDPLVPTAWVLEVTGPAVVLGSAQQPGPALYERAAAAGVDVVRRRSGGGAVWLAPEALWVDVLVPRRDPRWEDDIGVSGLWLGRRWAAALADSDAPPAAVHQGPMVRTELSAVVCFAGLGPGEVTAGAGGAKLVGVSQRRTGSGARFQCVAYPFWSPEPLASILGVAAGQLAAAGAGVGDVARVERALLAQLAGDGRP
ncbi:MAG: lipoyl protein ligase domain-containing protein [Acidimicrobiia bacterium]